MWGGVHICTYWCGFYQPKLFVFMNKQTLFSISQHDIVSQFLNIWTTTICWYFCNLTCPVLCKILKPMLNNFGLIHTLNCPECTLCYPPPYLLCRYRLHIVASCKLGIISEHRKKVRKKFSWDFPQPFSFVLRFNLRMQEKSWEKSQDTEWKLGKTLAHRKKVGKNLRMWDKSNIKVKTGSGILWHLSLVAVAFN